MRAMRLDDIFAQRVVWRVIKDSLVVFWDVDVLNGTLLGTKAL
jgi:hypothetical protein